MKKGFTLIEIMVSLAIFTVVAVIAVGALLKVMDANRKSINLKTAINNLNFALESMSREMRVGSDYYYSSIIWETIDPDTYHAYPGDTNLISGPWLIAFRSSITSTVNPPNGSTDCHLIYAYRYEGSPDFKIQKAQQRDNCEDKISSDEFFRDLTAENISITDSKVQVNNTSNQQPQVFFWFKGQGGVKDKDKVDFSIQTRASQRINNI